MNGSDKQAKPKRNKAKVDDRLGAALRENLRRRKEQERAREERIPPAPAKPDTGGGSSDG